MTYLIITSVFFGLLSLIAWQMNQSGWQIAFFTIQATLFVLSYVVSS